TGGGRADYVRFSAEGSLSRLQTDYIDLYILHRPDPKTPIAETLGALGELVSAGKVREIGCSDFSAAQLAEADAAAARGGPRIVNLQSEYSLLNRKVELGTLAECARLDIGFVPYRPLAHGLLTGKYRKGAALPEGSRIATMPEERRGRTLDERNLKVVEALIAFAGDHGHTILELATSWLLAHPEVSSVIGGAMSAEQIAGNAEAANWRLTPDEVAEVGELTASYRENPA
ncbi:MAG TPA: aldo/keto reductase, partial [Actinocrinis sp.]